MIKTIEATPGSGMSYESMASLVDSKDFVKDQRPLQNRVLIDYLCFTLPNSIPALACEVLEIDSLLFVPQPCGAHGYKSGWRLAHISIYYDGNADMGCHVQLTGQGCREYEAGHQRYGDDCWPRLIAAIAAAGGKLTRLDLAIDNVDRVLDMDRIREAVKNGEIRSRFKTGREISGFTCGRNGQPSTPTGSTIYFGSVSSRLQFRIYDKAAETGCEGHWVRFELQLREKRAQAAGAALRRESAGKVTLGIIHQYLSFITIDSTRSTRCSLADWWQSFLQGVSPLKLALAPVQKVVRDVMKHIHKQYAKSLGMIKQHLGVNDFCLYLKNLVEYGERNLSSRHLAILAASQLTT